MSDSQKDISIAREETRAERAAAGRALRKTVPLDSHGDWSPADNRPDPLQLLQEQDETRLQVLLPIKYGRMVASPFAFLRGSAVVMASDLSKTSSTGLNVVLCGDAHLSNFGLFATPERELVFDINDFDETFPGPWEWDLKRLAASAVVAGRSNRFKGTYNRDLALEAARVYRDAMQQFSQMTTLDVWYFKVNAGLLQQVFQARASKQSRKATRKTIKKARQRTQEQTLSKMTAIGKNGKRYFVSQPPLVVPFREDAFKQFAGAGAIDLSTLDPATIEKSVKENWNGYLSSLPDDRRFLLARFRLADAALRVGGVGSVGTRCYIVLLRGGAADDALILQLKEAGASSLAHFLAKDPYANHAERVVTGQRLMQASSDAFLGWHTSSLSDVQYYWRQLKDMKGSFDIGTLDESGLKTYVQICASCLARAHARTGDPASISGYIGKSDAFPTAISSFAVAYADQTEKDWQALAQAVKDGRITATTGV